MFDNNDIIVSKDITCPHCEKTIFFLAKTITCPYCEKTFNCELIQIYVSSKPEIDIEAIVNGIGTLND